MENRKRQYSRMVIEEAFLKELRHKPLEKISIVEICRRANVNRSTFYSNYLDVYDLMDQVADRFFRELFQNCVAELGEPNPNSNTDAVPFIRHALDATLAQRELCRLLVGSTYRAPFLTRLLDSLLDWSAKRYRCYSGQESQQFLLENTMIFGGTLVLWQRWVEGDFQESPQLLTGVINRYILENTRRIWNPHP